MTNPTIEHLRDHLEAASTHAIDDTTRQHLDEAVDIVDELPPTPLVDCPVCGVVGLPERIAVHDCDSSKLH